MPSLTWVLKSPLCNTAAADLLALVPFLEDLWGSITDVEESDTGKDILDRAFRNPEHLHTRKSKI